MTFNHSTHRSFATFACLSAIAAFSLTSCGEKKTSTETDSGAGGHVHDENCNHGHDHDHGDHSGHDHAKKVAGPNGGKVLSAPDFKCEFFVTSENKVKITFLDEDNKPAAIGTQSVDVVCGDRSDPTNLEFSKGEKNLSFASSNTLPKCDGYPVIITIKTAPDAKPA
ncbi:MAG: hypothetical protein ACPGUY_07895, partial [Akkermansiaceae bacterium]